MTKFFYYSMLGFYGLWSCLTDLSAQNINHPNIMGPAGLSVNSYTGNLLYQRTDLKIPCRDLPIDLTFYYNSSATAIDLGFGPGWSNTYSLRCIPDSNGVTIRRGDGRKDYYTKTGNAYTAPAGIFDTLVNYASTKFRITGKTGITYYFENDTTHCLSRITDPNGNSILIGYPNGYDSLPSTITDACGRHITLSYSGSHIVEISDSNRIPPVKIRYINDPYGCPVTVIGPVSVPEIPGTSLPADTIIYDYDALFNLTDLTDEGGYLFHIGYINCLRAGVMNSALNSVSISHDEGNHTTTVSEVVNGQEETTTYRFDSTGNLLEKNGNCCGYHESYQYDTKKNLTARTDARGYTWHYTYDSKGNILQETDPLGQFTHYTYEPVFNKMTSATDKNGNTIHYTYDTHGNLTQESKPLGVTEHYSYDTYGNMQSQTDGRGLTTNYSYDLPGNLTQETRSDGTTHTYTYDDQGNRLSETDARGYTTHFTYDLKNRETSRADALGNVTTYNYDQRGNKTAETDPLGHTTHYTYDDLQRRTSTSNPAGTTYNYYDEAGNTISRKDNNGNITHYLYDSRNRMTGETDPEGHTHTYTYDETGNRTSESDYSGHVTTYEYDPLNRPVLITDALGNQTHYNYDPEGNRTRVKDANNHISNYIYDALNRNTEIHYPIGKRHYVYDANNNRTALTDPNGNTTIYTYDNMNRNTVITDALGHNTSYNYDNEGNRISATDPDGHITLYTYDALNRNKTVTNPAGETVTTNYDAAGRVTSRVLPTGNTTVYTYDTANRVVSSADNHGNVRNYTWDANSNKLSETDGNGHTTYYSYDALNRIHIITDPMGHQTVNNYNNNSSLIGRQDRNGHTTTYTYDALERRTVIHYPAGNTSSTGYDPVGNPVSLTDGNGHTTQYLYDANDRLLTETYADGSAKHFTCDSAGNILSGTDNNGNVTNYTYDVLNRLVTRDYPGSNDDHFTYDAAGQLLSANNSHVVLNYTYDAAGRILSETMNGKVTTYAYDIPNRKRTLTYPGGRSVEENFDYRMRLSAIKEGGIVLAGFTWDNGDRIRSENYWNGVQTDYTCNNNDWISTISHVHGSDTIAAFNYGFDYEGNRLWAEKKHRPGYSENYTYDANDQIINYKEGTLIAGTIPAPITQTQYNYDGNGNRTTMIHDALTTTYATNSVNEYTNISGSPAVMPTYDLNGNTLYDGVHTYAYDYENHLVSVDGGATASYAYDPNGRRIQKITASGTINYYYDDQQVIEERDGVDSVQATYVYGTWIDDILNMRRTGADHYYQKNSLGSVVAITNSSGNVEERYEYDGYGNLSVYDGSYTPKTATTIGNTYTFTGREFDAETGNYHYRARQYKPDWGRFGQWDVYELTSLTACFGYVKNNPVNLLDPDGNITIEYDKGSDVERFYKFRKDLFNTSNWGTLTSNLKTAYERILSKDCLIKCYLEHGNFGEDQQLIERCFGTEFPNDRSGVEDFKNKYEKIKQNLSGITKIVVTVGIMQPRPGDFRTQFMAKPDWSKTEGSFGRLMITRETDIEDFGDLLALTHEILHMAGVYQTEENCKEGDCSQIPANAGPDWRADKNAESWARWVTRTNDNPELARVMRNMVIPVSATSAGKAKINLPKLDIRDSFLHPVNRDKIIRVPKDYFKRK